VSATLPPSARREEERLGETQERFLRAAAARLPLERVVELHLFPSLRQGGVETGFAVIAARRAPPEAAPEAAPEVAPGVAEARQDVALAEPETAPEPVDEAPQAGERLVVFSARYRLTLKGPDRGRWEVEVVEEADAPLVTVDAVVRGMQRRIGEGAEPERLTAEQLHALLDGPTGATSGG
jgi:hypothetical protein